MQRLTLPDNAVRDWAIKDLVSRESVPDDADDLQAATGIRRQLEVMQTYARHALTVYAKSVDVRPAEISDVDRASAALTIAALASDMRRELRDGAAVLPNVPIPQPTARQLATDQRVLDLLKFELAKITGP